MNLNNEKCKCETNQVDSICTIYNGECLELLKACKGENLEQILINLNTYLKFLLDSINSSISIKSIGEGKDVYKGKNGEVNGDYEFKSILETPSLDVISSENELILSVNEDWLSEYITNLQINIDSPKNTIDIIRSNTSISIDLNTSIFKSLNDLLIITPNTDGTVSFEIDLPLNITSTDSSVDIVRDGYVFDLSVPETVLTSNDSSITINDKDITLKTNLIRSSDDIIIVSDSINISGERDIVLNIDVESILRRSAYIGEIREFWGNINTIPKGFYLLDGRSVSSITSSVARANAISLGFSTVLPDSRKRVSVSLDTSSTEYNEVGKIGGLEFSNLTVDNLPSHSFNGSASTSGEHYHFMFTNDPQTNVYNPITSVQSPVPFYRAGDNANGYSISGSPTNRVSSNGRTSSSGGHSHTFTTNSLGNNIAHENRQPFIVLMKCIFLGD